MRILFLTETVPYPARYGRPDQDLPHPADARRRPRGAAARLHPRRGAARPPADRSTRLACRPPCTCSRARWPREAWFAAAQPGRRALLGGPPLRRGGVSGQVAADAAAWRPDLVYCDHLSMAEYALAARRCRSSTTRTTSSTPSCSGSPAPGPIRSPGPPRRRVAAGAALRGRGLPAQPPGVRRQRRRSAGADRARRQPRCRFVEVPIAVDAAVHGARSRRSPASRGCCSSAGCTGRPTPTRWRPSSATCGRASGPTRPDAYADLGRARRQSGGRRVPGRTGRASDRLGARHRPVRPGQPDAGRADARRQRHAREDPRRDGPGSARWYRPASAAKALPWSRASTCSWPTRPKPSPTPSPGLLADDALAARLAGRLGPSCWRATTSRPSGRRVLRRTGGHWCRGSPEPSLLPARHLFRLTVRRAGARIRRSRAFQSNSAFPARLTGA